MSTEFKNGNEYQSINPISKLEAKAKLEVLEGEELCLLLLALSDLDDVEWVQSISQVCK